MLRILSIIANAAFILILNLKLYTDRVLLPGGEARIWRRSPIDRLYSADQPALLYLQLFFAAVSAVAAVLLLLGVKARVVRIAWLAGTVASACMFVVVMLVSGAVHLKY